MFAAEIEGVRCECSEAWKLTEKMYANIDWQSEKQILAVAKGARERWTQHIASVKAIAVHL